MINTTYENSYRPVYRPAEKKSVQTADLPKADIQPVPDQGGAAVSPLYKPDKVELSIYNPDNDNPQFKPTYERPPLKLPGSDTNSGYQADVDSQTAQDSKSAPGSQTPPDSQTASASQTASGTQSAPDSQAASAPRTGSESPDQAGSPDELTDQEKNEIRELEQIDSEVKAHEAAHKAAAGGLSVGSASFGYTTGPDGKRYATSGEVSIDTSTVPGDPDATIQKMQTVKRAALAPAQPSGQDRKVAAMASRTEAQARAEKATQLQEKNRPEKNNEKTDKTEGENNSVQKRTAPSETPGPLAS